MLRNLEDKIYEGTNAFTQCVEIGNGFSTSVISSLNEQTKEACETIKKHPIFGKSEFNILGLS